MSDYIISCGSAADLTAERFKERELYWIPFHYGIDGEDYLDDLGKTIPFPEFYGRMDKGAETYTARINIAEYMDHFTPFLEQGKDIIHVELSSGITGTIDSARNAAEMLKETYPERKIYIIDSYGASMGYGLLMDTAADLRDSGLTVDELAAKIEELRLHVQHWFYSMDLSGYVRGGRISKAAAVFGGALQICPLLNMDYIGRLIPREKIRTKRRVIREIVKRMQMFADDGENYSGRCYISQSNCYEDARQVADLVEAAFPSLKDKVEINWVGTTIGAHTGPDTVALFFFGDRRTE